MGSESLFHLRLVLHLGFLLHLVATRRNYRSFARCSGLDGRGLVWDLRTGQCVMSLDGHLKKVLGIDFARDG